MRVYGSGCARCHLDVLSLWWCAHTQGVGHEGNRDCFQLLLHLPSPVALLSDALERGTQGAVVVVTLTAIASAYASSATKGSFEVYEYIRCMFCASYSVSIGILVAGHRFGKR